MRLQILHVTTYAYRAPVALLAHRMMLSPRGSHALRPISADLSCEPPAEFEWAQDVFGNLIATASFPDPTARLVITNRVTVEQTAAAWPILKIAPHAHYYPFDYSHEERTDLGALLVPEHPDPEGRLPSPRRQRQRSRPAGHCRAWRRGQAHGDALPGRGKGSRTAAWSGPFGLGEEVSPS
ncbi:transglutaminase-like putative cysteine protease [Sphingomonas naasensis]|uniref:Bacterial transglutaminase-like N-terminal domain-containing protein n=1 Tax=Sphingomonas naasensis TaxID=1344951 RepID=A0A4S1WPD0_9SPHN|nr:transglutaminase N-terminal domain-containing protein [Sphingomonas naasensis]NIJ20259.1 transglutaminase-like putative cysteine protease [Sphingomonas naasensis]TGX44395.1 hypothetical protein E5A74_06260 [Sphingomonas naasensis]